MQRGFIQIPILIVITIIVAVLGGTSYITYKVGKYSQDTSRSANATTTDFQTTTSTTRTQNNEGENKNSIIESLQKQVSDLTKKVSEPKAEEAKPIETNAEEPKTAASEKISASTNPAAQCLATKTGWDNFATAINTLNKQLNTVLASYNDLAFGTKNKPTGTSALFSYNYTRMTTGKSSFTYQISETRKLMEALPQPPHGTVDDLKKIRDGYSKSLTYLENSYELALQAFKIFGEDNDGQISSTELSTSYSLFKDSSAEYDKIDPELQNSKRVVLQSQTDLEHEKVPGCNFTFNNDRTIQTTINDEWLFTQQTPKSEAVGNTVRISIKTKLPITVNDGGQVKTVLKLICNEENRPVTHFDENTVVNIMSKSYTTIRVQCNFFYSGNGNDLSTKTLDFNW